MNRFSNCFTMRRVWSTALTIVALMFLSAAPAAGQYTITEQVLDGGGGRVEGGRRVLTSSLAPIPVGTVQSGRFVLYSAFPGPLTVQVEQDVCTAVAGQPCDVTVRILTDSDAQRTATLFYGNAVSVAATAVSMSRVGDGFEATIPGGAIGEAGLTYYFEIVNDQGVQVRVPRQGVLSLPVQLPGDGPRRPEGHAGGDTQAAYRLLSVPVTPDDPSPEAVLGDDIPTLANASAYDNAVARLFEPIGTRLAEYPGTGDFELGSAFWLIVRDEVATIDAGPGQTQALTDPFQKPLEQGWNFIGTPFTVPVPVANLQTSTGDPITLRSFRNGSYNAAIDPVIEMRPFEGYAVYVPAPTVLTIQPPRSDAGGVALVAKSAAGTSRSRFPWYLRVRGTAGTGWDTDNVAAVHTDASDGWDAADWPEPPSLGGGLRVTFDAPMGAPEGVALSADVRRPLASGGTWPLTVETAGAGPVHLTVEGVTQVPAAFEVMLLDLATKATWDLRRTPSARVDVLSKEGGTRSLQLLVGTTEYLRRTLKTLDIVPQVYALNPPYPNPSSGTVAFQLELPQDDDVSIEVYNILGQRLAVLKHREPMRAGFHTVVWDAPRLASGMYFVRMKAGDYQKTQKMVRIR